MYVCIFSLSFSRLSFSLTFLSLSCACSLSLVLSLSFSLLSRCPSLYLCRSMSLGIFMCHARTCARFFTLTPFLSFSLSLLFSLSLSHSLSLFPLYIYVHTKAGKFARNPICLASPYVTLWKSISATRFSRCFIPAAATTVHLPFFPTATTHFSPCCATICW